MKEWIKSQLWEIKNSPSLKYLGVVMALSHLATFFLWRSQDTGPWSQSETSTVLCWNFFPNCTEVSFLTAENFQALLLTYGILAGIGLFGFIFHRLIFLGWAGLSLAYIAHLVFYTSDYSLFSNTQTLLIVLCFFFLFIPQKASVAKLLIFSSYFALGLLKLNTDWLAGFWLSDQFPELPIKGIEWLAVFSILIEFLAPWSLFSRVGQRFLLGFGFLLVYHSLQLAFLDHFTGAMHLSLIFYFAVSYLEDQRLAREYIYQSYIRPQPSRSWVAVALVLFWALQLLPIWVPNQTLAENPLRLQAYPVPLKCQQQNFAIFKNKTLELSENSSATIHPSLQCNAFVRFSFAKQFCETYKADPEFENVSSFFLLRKLSDSEFSRIFEITNICDESVQFRHLEVKR